MIDYTNEIKSILRSSSDLTEEQMAAVSNDTDIASLGIDSLSLVEAIIEIEKKFKVDIELSGPWMDEVDISVNQINKMICEKLHG
jgi:acyl carrier protein